MIEKKWGLYLYFSLKRMVFFEYRILLIVVRIPPCMWRCNSIEVCSTWIGCLVELVHHILIKLFYYIEHEQWINIRMNLKEIFVCINACIRCRCALCARWTGISLGRGFQVTIRFYPMLIKKCTLRPSLVRTSTGLKYLTSLGLKNMKRIVDRLRFILKGYPVRMMRSRIIWWGSHLANSPLRIGAPSIWSVNNGLTLKIKKGEGGKWFSP